MSEGWSKGYVHIYTGNGKGKTTAALGLALRALGAGFKVFIAQFIKNAPTSEMTSLKLFGDQVVFKQYGRGFIFNRKASQEDIEASIKGLDECEQALKSGEYRLVTLDEINGAISCGLLSEKQVMEVINARHKSVEVALTGRGASERLIQWADLVTEMRDTKHYFSSGVKARKGIEK